MLLCFKIYFNNIEVITYILFQYYEYRTYLYETFMSKRLSARLHFCVKSATSLRHQYLVLQHPLTLTKLI
jgi:hypothetical protein